jgi:hypothetical protein
VLQALAVGRGLPNGLTFANPPLFKYLLLLDYAAAFGIERLMGATHSPTEFVEQFRADPSTLYLLARLTSAFASALTVLATGWLGCLVAGRRAAVLAAGLCAVTYLVVRDAHFGVDDSLVTLLVTLGLVACVHIIHKGRRRDYFAAGALTGLAFAAKYDGIAVMAPLVLAHVVRRRRLVEGGSAGGPGKSGGVRSRQSGAGDLAVAAAACTIAAVAAFPSLITEPGRVLDDVYVHLYLEAVGGYDGLDPSGGYAFYARTLVIGMGWGLLAASALGVVLSVVHRRWSSLVVASLPLCMLSVLGSQHLYFARFALPVLPALLVEAAVALDWLFARQRLVGLAVTLLVIVPTFGDALRFDALLGQADTRTLARDWMQASLPPGARVAADAPPLGPSVPGSLVAADSTLSQSSLFELTPAEYAAQGVDYLAVSSFTTKARALDPRREAQRVAFIAALQTQATRVAEFRSYVGQQEPPFVYDMIYGPYTDLDRLASPGPNITIYRLTR